MPGDLGGVQRGNPSQEAPTDILEASNDGGEIGGAITGQHSRENAG